MCTVSVVPRDEGFRLVCNRDERESRAAALRPQRRQIGRRYAMFPIDPDSGGTWVGVNDAALGLAVLNRSTANEPGATGPPARSRGVLIPSLIGCDSVPEALHAAESLDLRCFAPFQLVVVQQGMVGVVTWDGAARTVEGASLTRPWLFTSSSLGDARVEPPRRRLFADMVLEAPDSWLDGQRRFHRHQWPARPELSVLMARPGVRSVSRSTIDVADGVTTFEYQPLSRLARAA